MVEILQKKGKRLKLTIFGKLDQQVLGFRQNQTKLVDPFFVLES